MAPPISIDYGQQEEQAPVSIDVGSESTPVSKDVADQRAMKATIGLPGFSDFDSMREAIVNNQEQDMRKMAAGFADWRKNQIIQGAVTKIATQTGRDLTPEEDSRIRGIISLKADTDPRSVFEEYYPKEFMNYVRKTGVAVDDSWLKDVQSEEIDPFVDRGTELETWRQYMNTKLENTHAELSAQSYGGWFLDQAKNLIPGYWSAVQRGGVVPLMEGGLSTAANYDAQLKAYLRMPFKERKDRFDADLAALKEKNPGMAVTWLEGLMKQSTDDMFMNDALTTLDIFGFPTLVKPLISIPGKVSRAIMARDLIKSALQTNAKGVVGRETMAEAAGDIKESAILQASREVAQDLKGASNPVRNDLEGMHSSFNGAIENLETNRGSLGQEQVNRLKEMYFNVKDSLIKTIYDSLKVERLPALAQVDAAVRKVSEAMKKYYPGLENSILDTGLRKDVLGNWQVDFKIGNGTELFRSRSAAERYAKEFSISGAEVKDQGNFFYLVKSRPLPETDPFVRSVLMELEGAKTPGSWLSAANIMGLQLGKLRTPEEVLSLAQLLNRKVATFGPAQFHKLIQESSKDIKALRSYTYPFTERRKIWKEWQDVMAAAKGRPDPATGQKGYMFSSPLDLQTFYMNKLGRLPSEQEVYAAYAAKRNEEIAQVIASTRRHINQVRLGTQTHTIRILDKYRETAKSAPFRDITIDGSQMKEWPTRADTMVRISSNSGDISIVNSGTYRGKVANDDKEAVLKGQKVLIQLSNPEENALAGFGHINPEHRVRYILADNHAVQTKSLDFRMVNTRPLDYDYEHYVKQAIMRKDPVTGYMWYEGDRTIAAFNLRAMGKDVTEKLNEIRKLLKSGDEVGARNYYMANPLGKNYDEIRGWFGETPVHRAFVGTSEPEYLYGHPAAPVVRLSLDEPIHLTDRHHMIMEMDKDLAKRHGDKFRNGAAEGYGKYVNDKYDRYDIFTLENTGTKDNPLYGVKPIKYLDPTTSLNRSLNKVVNSLYMDDYKIFSVEHWIQEAKDLMSVGDKELAQAPYHYFFHPEWNPGAPVERVNNLQLANLQIKQFIGVQNETTTFLHALGQDLADSLYSSKNLANYAHIPTSLLPMLRDPFGKIRSLTFDATLGLFNVPQLMVQLNTFAAIYGIAGTKFAAPGTKAAMLHLWSRVSRDPDMLEHFDKLATVKLLPGTSAWRPGEWKEAFKLLSDTGFEHVAQEVAQRDNFWKYDFIGDERSKFLNWGRFFFREGERNVRTGAFYTAFREFRDAHPTGALSDIDKQTILHRADTLAINMSRASSSQVQQGVFSLPLQFLSYQLRLGELFLGKRLTSTERFRLFGTYGALYGFPVAYSLTGLPIGDYIREAAIKDGYVVGDNWLNSTVTEGIPSMLMALITGNWYNVGDRYGVQGFEPLRTAMRSDKTMWQILGGAAGSKMWDTLKGTSGFYNAMLSGIADDGKVFPKRVEDFVEPFKAISSVNAAWNLYAAIHTGRWLSKNEINVGDASTGNAIFKFISGLQPQQLTDIYTKQSAMQEEKDLQQEAEKRFKKEWQRALMDLSKGNSQQSKDGFTRAFRWLDIAGYPDAKRPELLSRAARDHESLIESTDWQFYVGKNVPQSRPDAMKSYQRIQGLK